MGKLDLTIIVILLLGIMGMLFALYLDVQIICIEAGMQWIDGDCVK